MMLWACLLLSVYYAKVKSAEDYSSAEITSSRVYDGVESIPHSRPYIVQIHTNLYSHHGVLLNRYTILVEPETSFLHAEVTKISAGKHLFYVNETTEQIRSSYCDKSIHKGRDNPIKSANCYSLIHLSDPFTFNSYVNSITLAPKGFVPKDCVVAGWGSNKDGAYDYSNVLLERSIEIVDCAVKHPTIACYKSGVCHRDLGNPVVCSADSKIYLYGITVSTTTACAASGGFISVASELPRNWLAEQLELADKACNDGDDE